MVPDRLIEILRCPATMQRVRRASDEELQSCNRRIAGGEMISTGGVPKSAPLTDGLIREDGKLLFPIAHGIPVMLLEEALVLG